MGLDPRWLATEHALLQPKNNQKIRHATLSLCPTALPLQRQHPGLSTACHSLSPPIFTLKPTLGLRSMLTYIFNSPFPYSVYTMLTPLLCNDLLVTPRHSALFFKKSPLFLGSGKKFTLPCPQGFSVGLFLALLLLKPKE